MPSLPVGINLSMVNYYATQVPFEDVFKNRDDWFSTDGTTWDTGMAGQIPRDSNGYPTQIPYSGQMLRASAFLPVYPTFDDPVNDANDVFYNVTFDGDGDLSFLGPGLTSTRINANAYKIHVARYATVADSVSVRIDRSTLGNNVRNIKIIQNKPITDDFLKAMGGFRVLRFMDWGQTNGNPVSQWSQRTLPGQAEGAERGVAIETMIATANKLKADFWYNIPHQADDNFITNAANLISSTLDPSLKVYVEYSNENWNGAPAFTQVPWEQNAGVQAGLDQVGPYSVPDPGATYWAGLKYSVRRAAKAHQVFRQVLGTGRVVAVLAGQSAFPALNAELLNFYRTVAINPLWTNLNSAGVPNDANAAPPQVFAVAPYVDVHFTPADAGLTVAQIVQRADNTVATAVGAYTQQNRAVADQYGARLIAYEAGQHLIAVDGLENDAVFMQRLLEANRSPGMGDVYRHAHRAWIDNGGGLIVYFNSCEASSTFGNWGALEYQDQPIAMAPKMAALREFQRSPDRVVAIRTKNNARYVAANDSGATTLINDRTAVGGWERFLLHMNADGTYSLKALVNGQYVCADFNINSNGPLIANRPAAGPWERFDLTPTTDGYFALRSLENRKYVTFSSSGTGPATATATTVGNDEKVTLIEQADHVVGLRARQNQRYVMADNSGNSPLVNRAVVIGSWEKFQLSTNADNTISLKALVNNKYVSAESPAGTPWTADKTTIGASEKFEPILTVDGFVAYRSPLNGRFFTFDPSGNVAASARAVLLLDWEKVSVAEAVERPVALLAKSNGRYASVGSGSNPLVYNNATSIGTAERFVMFVNADGTVSFRAITNTKYVCADNNGSSPLVVNRQTIGPWEKFELIGTSDGYVALRSTTNSKYVTFSSGGTTAASAQSSSITDAEKITMPDL